jgi:hypothetical protein
MRLYTRTGATALDDPDHGHFDASEEGGFDFPEELSDRLHRFHVNGSPLWESEAEKQQRLIAEERKRSEDPGVMLDLMRRLVDASEAKAVAEKPAPKRTPRAKPADRTD